MAHEDTAVRAICASVAVLLIASTASADDVFEPHNPEYENLSIAAPQAAVDPDVAPASFRFAEGAGGGCSGVGCGDTACRRCRQSRFTGWYALGEVTVHQPSFSTSLFTFNGDNAVGGRLIVGHEKSDGFGIRGRFWGAGNDELETIGVDPPHTSVPMEFDVTLLEADFYKRMWIGDSNITVGAGPRAGSINISTVGNENRIGGGGVGAFLEYWQPWYLGDVTTLAFVGHGRASFLSGNADLAGTDIEIDTTLTVAEAAFGFEFRRQLGRGDLVGTFLLESQLWDANVFADLVLDGGTFRFGYQW